MTHSNVNPSGKEQSMSTPTIYATGSQAELRKILKASAKAGGPFFVKTDSRPPNELDARAIVALAQGKHPAKVHFWHKGGGRGGWLSRKYGRDSSVSRDVTLIGGYFVRDEAYEARVTAWASRFIESEAVAT